MAKKNITQAKRVKNKGQSRGRESERNEAESEEGKGGATKNGKTRPKKGKNLKARLRGEKAINDSNSTQAPAKKKR